MKLDRMMETGEDVYVRNRTDGQLCLTVSGADGKPTTLFLPKTKNPICLSDMLPKKTILESLDIKHYMNDGALEPMDAKDAERILRTPEGKMEAERLRKQKFTPSFAETTQSAKDFEEIEKLKQQENLDDKVQLRVKDILLREETSKNIIAMLAAEDLSKDDLEYIVLNSDGRVKNWAENKLDPNKEKPRTKSVKKVKKKNA